MEVSGDLEARYRALGYTDADAPVEQQDEAASEKPRRRTRKKSDDE